MESIRGLYIEIEESRRYLANRSDVAIERLTYSTWSIHFNMPGEDDVTVSRIPTYELQDIPAQARVYLEDIDRFEGGMIMFEADEVMWADGQEDRKVKLKERRRKQLGGTSYIDARAKYIQTGDEAVMQDPEPELETVEREKKLVGEVPSRTSYAAERRQPDDEGPEGS